MEITEAVIDDNLLEDLINQPAEPSMILSKPRVVTRLQNQANKDRTTINLSDFYNSKEDLDRLYRVKVTLIGVMPQNVKEFVQAFCPTCNFTKSYSGLGHLSECDKCGSQLVPVFKLVFYVKDEKSLANDEIYKVHYYSPVGQPSRLDA